MFWTKPHSSPPFALKQLQNEIFTNKNLKEMHRLVGLLNSETRLQILFLLLRKDSLCVGDIADTLRLSFSAVSHQLRKLRQEKIVQAKKRKKVVYYSLGQPLPSWAQALLDAGSSV